MRKLTYKAVLEYNGKGGYGVFFPDVPGCVSCGDNFEHALEMAKEALELHIYGLEKDNYELPVAAGELPELEKGDLITLISIYPDLIKDTLNNAREKTTITLPHWLKSIAEKEGVNCSRLLETALKEALGLAS
ncbi:MAG: type II toxin-antitoxin system HicB family antitoxin [Spirochaetaceae bacterium]|jgi:predicted RNase H-like HicB family nuclease|nr:type II toxin-antitoxin system HicB family antitoxin [Spirochaetaceae bacterium]